MSKKTVVKLLLLFVHLKDAHDRIVFDLYAKWIIIYLSKVEIQRNDHGAFLMNGTKRCRGKPNPLNTWND